MGQLNINVGGQVLAIVTGAVEGTVVEALVVRNEAGTGTCQISSGFPVPPGLVTESTITTGKIVVAIGGVEVAANVTGLRGRHNDNTFRSVLIQFEHSMAYLDQVVATVTFNGAVRASADPTYVLVTQTMVINNNVIVPTNTTYLCSTRVALRGLVPTGGGTTAEEALYTTFIQDRIDNRLMAAPYSNLRIAYRSRSSNWATIKFDSAHAMTGWTSVLSMTDPTYNLAGFQAQVVNSTTLTYYNEGSDEVETAEATGYALRSGAIFGTSRYNEPLALATTWCRFGTYAYHKTFIEMIMGSYYIYFNTPTPTYGGGSQASAAAAANPDGHRVVRNWVTGAASEATGLSNEWSSTILESYPVAYLLTGYRDIWGMVCYLVQCRYQGWKAANDVTHNVTGYHTQPTNRRNSEDPSYSYSAIVSALMIDATMSVDGRYFGGDAKDWEQCMEWLLSGLSDHAWDFVWLPYDTGTGNVPATGTTITQGAVEGTLQGVFQNRGHREYYGLSGTVDTDTTWVVLDSEDWVVSAHDLNNYWGGDVTDRITAIDAANNKWQFGSSRGTAAQVLTETLCSTRYFSGQPLPPDGFLMVNDITGGTFAAAALGGISANATGPVGSDYRNGITGVRDNYRALGMHPNFQQMYPATILMNVYLYFKRDARIPPLLKAMLDSVLLQMRALQSGDTGYGYGATHGYPYSQARADADGLPIIGSVNCTHLPDMAGLIQFVIKMYGDLTVNGAEYSTWYGRCIDPDNLNPGFLNYFWSYLGWVTYWGGDAPWIAQQADLEAVSPATMRVPTQWNAIPSATPDYARA